MFNNDRSTKAYKIIMAVIVIFVGIVIAVGIVIMVAINWQWFNENSGAIIAIATLLLAVVTFYYATILQQQRRDMQKAEIGVVPIKESEKYLLCVINNGPGVALDIKGKIYGKKQNNYSQILHKDERSRPLQSGKGFKYILDTNHLQDIEMLTVEISFKEVGREEKKISPSFKVSDIKEWSVRELELFTHFYGINEK